MNKIIEIVSTIFLVVAFIFAVLFEYQGDSAASTRWLAYMAFYFAAIAWSRT